MRPFNAGWHSLSHEMEAGIVRNEFFLDFWSQGLSVLEWRLQWSYALREHCATEAVSFLPTSLNMTRRGARGSIGVQCDGTLG